VKVGDLIEFKRENCAPAVLSLYPHLREMGMVVGWESFHPIVIFPSGIKRVAKGQIRKVISVRN
jgi:hypothetical protein